MLGSYSVISNCHRPKNLNSCSMIHSSPGLSWTFAFGRSCVLAQRRLIFILTYVLRSDPEEEGAVVFNQTVMWSCSKTLVFLFCLFLNGTVRHRQIHWPGILNELWKSIFEWGAVWFLVTRYCAHTPSAGENGSQTHSDARSLMFACVHGRINTCGNNTEHLSVSRSDADGASGRKNKVSRCTVIRVCVIIGSN